MREERRGGKKEKEARKKSREERRERRKEDGRDREKYRDRWRLASRVVEVVCVEEERKIGLAIGFRGKSGGQGKVN